MTAMPPLCIVPSMAGMSCLNLATAEALLTSKHHSPSVSGPAAALVCRPSGILLSTKLRQRLDSPMRDKSPASVLDSAIASKTVGIV